MAFRNALKNLRWSLNQQAGEGRRLIGTSTTPKLKSMSPAIENAADSTPRPRITLKADLAPVYIVWGFVGLALTIATHTAYQHLARSPSVSINKKRRESMSEVDDPDRTIKSADKFINGSFLRKVSQIQENKTTLHDPVHPNPYTRPRTAETLKSVGVEPSKR